MDRRLFIAVGLSILVLLIFQTWIAPPPAEPPPEDSPGRMGETPPPTAQMQSPGMGSEPPLPGSIASPLPSAGDDTPISPPIVLQTPLVNAGFSSVGGQLISWDLKQFAGPDGLPVRIVRGPSEFGVMLDSPQGVMDLSDTIFEMREESLSGGARRVVFTAGTPGGLLVRKTYTLPADDYLVDLTVEISGAAAESYRLVWDGGIPPAEKSRKQFDGAVSSIMLLGESVKKFNPGSFKNEARKPQDGSVRWAGVRNKYFCAVMVPPPNSSTHAVATGDRETKVMGAEVVMPLLQGGARHDFKLYLGPMEFDRLQAYGLGLETAVDLGWKVFRPLSQLLLKVMKWMYGFIPNYGIVIIIISVLTKVLFYPLTKSSLKSMKAMQMVQPEMAALKEKYKGDPQKVQAATMELYKKHKVNPLGGCLPMVVQMPVFVALYSVLANSITMRQANFGGWINDLSTPDTVAVIAGFAIHVLPVIMFFTTVLQQRLTPVTDARQKMMGYMMPVVMLFIFYSFPAGLNLYWTVNNGLQVAQQWWIHRGDGTRVTTPSAA